MRFGNHRGDLGGQRSNCRIRFGFLDRRIGFLGRRSDLQCREFFFYCFELSIILFFVFFLIFVLVFVFILFFVFLFAQCSCRKGFFLGLITTLESNRAWCLVVFFFVFVFFLVLIFVVLADVVGGQTGGSTVEPSHESMGHSERHHACRGNEGRSKHKSPSSKDEVFGPHHHAGNKHGQGDDRTANDAQMRTKHAFPKCTKISAGPDQRTKQTIGDQHAGEGCQRE